MSDLVRRLYYDQRAPVYDKTSYRGDPQVDAALDRETAELGSLLSEISGRTLEVGCGTGIFTQFLRGEVVALDQSEPMLRLAKRRVPTALFVKARLPVLPFISNSFDSILAANIYGLLRPKERNQFLSECRRVAHEMIVIDLRSDDDLPSERLERREVDGGVYYIYRRRFAPLGLREELEGTLWYPGQYFLAVRTKWPSTC